jgi:tetratricopeptide (TPR) repeat protein
VECDFCHARAKLPPGVILKPGEENFDFALDEKPTKKVARQMMLMLRSINAMVPTAVGKSSDKTVQLQCFNCHRGMQTPPLPLADILDQTVKEKGVAAAIAQYKDLRRRYYGAVIYDFSDGEASDPASPGMGLGGLDDYALRLIQTGKPDDAIPWLNLNLQYFPTSGGTWALISMAQQKKKDKTAAIKSAQKAVELGPTKFGYKWILAQAKTMP